MTACGLEVRMTVHCESDVVQPMYRVLEKRFNLHTFVQQDTQGSHLSVFQVLRQSLLSESDF